MKMFQKIFIASLLLLIFIQVAVGMRPSIETDTLSISNITTLITTLQNETVAVEPPECMQGFFYDGVPVPGARNVPITANINIFVDRFAPPIIDHKIEPEVITDVNVVTLTQPEPFNNPVGFMYNFHPANLLQPGTTYTITVTFRQGAFRIYPSGFCPATNVTTSWQFTTVTGTVLRYAGQDGMIDKLEAVQAVRDYSGGVITIQEAIDVVMAYFANTDLT